MPAITTSTPPAIASHLFNLDHPSSLTALQVLTGQAACFRRGTRESPRAPPRNREAVLRGGDAQSALATPGLPSFARQFLGFDHDRRGEVSRPERGCARFPKPEDEEQWKEVDEIRGGAVVGGSHGLDPEAASLTFTYKCAVVTAVIERGEAAHAFGLREETDEQPTL